MTLRISIAYLGANGCHQNMENVTVRTVASIGV